MAFINYVWPFVVIYSRIIEEVRPKDGKVVQGKPIILALNPQRFLGDLEVLVESKEFRILKVPFDWQCKILALYWNDKVVFPKYYDPEGDVTIIKIQTKLRRFLNSFLSELYKSLKIDCVIGAAANYRHDYDWGLVSSEIGVPYIVLHKENTVAGTNQRAGRIENIKKRKKFRGDHVVVHNATMKDIFIQSGYAKPDQISVLGCLRMDDYINKIKGLKRIKKQRKKVTLFSFPHIAGIAGSPYAKGVNDFSKNRDVGFVNLFEHVHVAFVQLALSNNDVDFIIKPKWGGRWRNEIEYVCKKNNIELRHIDNLSILDEVNVHDLIFESDVVCGYGSTVLLEAAIAAKPVLVPYFDEVLNPEYSDFILFKDYFHIFDIAHSIEEFRQLIINRLDNQQISHECMKERYAVFEKYVSSMKCNARDQYIGLIQKVVKKSKINRNC